FDEESYRSLAHEYPGKQKHESDNVNGGGQTQNIAIPKPEVGSVINGHDLSVRDELSDAATRHHEDQCRDHWLDPGPRHEKSIPETTQCTRGQIGQYDDGQWRVGSI